MYNIFLYLIIIYFLIHSIDFFEVFLIVPLIELISQIGFFFPGAQELSTITFFSLGNFSFELAVVIAIIYRAGDVLSIGLHSLYFLYKKKL